MEKYMEIMQMSGYKDGLFKVGFRNKYKVMKGFKMSLGYI